MSVSISKYGLTKSKGGDSTKIYEHKVKDTENVVLTRINGELLKIDGAARAVSIDQRPKEVELRDRIGDLEIDTIIGKDHKGAILTINDRSTGVVKIKKLQGKNAEMLAQAAIEVLQDWKPNLKTITADNGKEFASHQLISQALNVPFFFAHPYHSWERGSNENLNAGPPVRFD